MLNRFKDQPRLETYELVKAFEAPAIFIPPSSPCAVSVSCFDRLRPVWSGMTVDPNRLISRVLIYLEDCLSLRDRHVTQPGLADSW
jgi:hypothetical protein